MGDLVRLQDVAMSFGNKHVLSGMNMSIAAGSIVALMGASGCGKTTVLRLIAGLIGIQEGALSLFGTRLDAGTNQELIVTLRKRMGIVFQSGALFDSLTVGENVCFPLKFCLGITDEDELNERVRHMLSGVELEEIEGLYPAELSGGMRRRVAIARALVYDPELLLLDEPTTGLDPMTARHIDRLVANLGRRSEAAVLLVTHDLVSALGVADTMLLMDEGRIAWSGTPEEWHTTDDTCVRFFSEGMIPVMRGGERWNGN